MTMQPVVASSQCRRSSAVALFAAVRHQPRGAHLIESRRHRRLQHPRVANCSNGFFSHSPRRSSVASGCGPPRHLSSKGRDDDHHEGGNSPVDSDTATTTAAAGSSRAERRRDLLDLRLREIGVDADELHAAAVRSIDDPINSGYDGRFGKSAIRAYRSFLYPKKKSAEDSDDDSDFVRLGASARRCAQQVDFLLKRHKSHETEWVRHHDASQVEDGDSDGTSSRNRASTFPIVLLLDNVRSAQNVGSLFRTADAAGCEMVVTVGLTPHPGGGGAEKLRKTALGAELVVPSAHFATAREAVEHLRSEKPSRRVVALETTDRSVSYADCGEYYSREGGVVLVLGNEVTGVDAELLASDDGGVDAIVEIPMFGSKNSLNIAACAPVVLYEIIRQWTSSDGRTDN